MPHQYRNKIIDGHLDVAWNYQSLGCCFQLSTWEKTQNEADHIQSFEGEAAVGLPELRRGNFGLIVASIWIEPENSVQPSIGLKYASLPDALRMAYEQLDYYLQLEREEGIRIIRKQSDISDCLSAGSDFVGIAISIEGADFIFDFDDLMYWYRQGYPYRDTGLAAEQIRRLLESGRAPYQPGAARIAGPNVRPGTT